MKTDSKLDTPYKRAVHMIIHSIINCEDNYVLDNKYVRWGKLERDLWTLEEVKEIDGSTCELCGWVNGTPIDM